MLRESESRGTKEMVRGWGWRVRESEEGRGIQLD